jgi:hypothetical protein
MRREDVPNFVWISPNLCHDMHGGVIVRIQAGDGSPCPFGYDNPADVALKRKADSFVHAAVRTIMGSQAWREPSAIFILSDETTETGRASSLLATLEENWDLGYLGYAADRAQVPLMDAFVRR